MSKQTVNVYNSGGGGNWGGLAVVAGLIVGVAVVVNAVIAFLTLLLWWLLAVACVGVVGAAVWRLGPRVLDHVLTMRELRIVAELQRANNGVIAPSPREAIEAARRTETLGIRDVVRDLRRGGAS